MKPKRHCKTCLHWDRAAAEDAAGRVRSDRYAPCRWIASAPLDFPIPPWLLEAFRRQPWTRHYMTCATDGANCRVWSARELVRELEGEA